MGPNRRIIIQVVHLDVSSTGWVVGSIANDRQVSKTASSVEWWLSTTSRLESAVLSTIAYVKLGAPYRQA